MNTRTVLYALAAVVAVGTGVALHRSLMSKAETAAHDASKAAKAAREDLDEARQRENILSDIVRRGNAYQTNRDNTTRKGRGYVVLDPTEHDTDPGGGDRNEGRRRWMGTTANGGVHTTGPGAPDPGRDPWSHRRIFDPTNPGTL